MAKTKQSAMLRPARLYRYRFPQYPAHLIAFIYP